MKKALKKFLTDEEGATMTEYILLVALVAIAMFAVITLFGKQIAAMFTKSKDKLKEAEDTVYP